ncbi:MAG: efflux RND transporter periplasmic adaptor subunit [Bacteroidia bacterium]|nr:efflux RND transporter periplasmic adaptor subunit [Bacteroidia bacterium]
MSLRKTLISIGIAIAFLILAGSIAARISASRQPAPRVESVEKTKTVKVKKVQNAASSSLVEITGRLAAREKIEVYSEVGGVLKPESSRFREGNFFQKGNPLIVMDDQEPKLALLAQKSSLMNQITLMLPDMKTDFPASFPKWENYLASFDPDKTLQPLPQPGSDQEKYYLSARNLYNLYYSIKSQETRLAKYVIPAPFSGKVSESLITEGTLVRVGQKLGTFFNPSSYELEAAVNLQDLEFIRLGDQVELYSNDIEGNWKGTVRRISDVIDPNTQNASVFIATSGKELREGMYLSAKVKGKKLDQVTEISRNLLEENNQIFVIDNGALKLFTVTPVKYSSETVLVRGIPDGTEILDEAVIGAYEGMKVSTY